MKLEPHYSSDQARSRRRQLLALLPLALGLLQNLPAATNAPALEPNHWRQLWGKQYDDWNQKSLADLVALGEQGRPAAQFLFWQKFGGTHKEKAAAFLEAAAASKLPQALFQKGYTTFTGYQVPAEKRLEGWALMQKAAETGYPYARLTIAQYEIGRISSEGLVKPNLKRALEYFRDSADAGYPDAMAELALLYSSGIGEPRGEADTPHNLLSAAAQRGCRAALGHLSDRYALGHGETVDPFEAARLRFLAGDYSSGAPGANLVDSDANPVAQNTIAWDDLARALSLFVKAAQHRNEEAAFALATKYLEAGKPAESVILFRFAKDLGSAAAQAELKKLEPTLTPEQKTRTSDKKLFPFATPSR